MKNILSQNQIDDIKGICLQYKIQLPIVRNDGSIDTLSHVNLFNMGLKEFPVTFNNVKGYFECSDNKLTSLLGAPKLAASFFCNNNMITSLVGAPQIAGNFSCKNNKISTLEGCPVLLDEYNFDNNKFPTIVMKELLFQDNHDMINLFLKYQDHYYVWENGFNEQGFKDLILDIEEGLK